MDKGTRLLFKNAFHLSLYGEGATVVDIGVVASRPFGTRTTLVSLKTDNGTDIQWPMRQVKRDLKITH